MPAATFWIAAGFSAIGAIYLVLGLRTPAFTAAGPNPARKARLRTAGMHLLVAAVMLFREVFS